MAVTKTAKRALRSSKRKEGVNKRIRLNLDAAMRIAKKEKKRKNILTAISLADRAAKKHIIHRNKAARIKSTLSGFLLKPKKSASQKSPKTKKSSPIK